MLIIGAALLSPYAISGILIKSYTLNSIGNTIIEKDKTNKNITNPKENVIFSLCTLLGGIILVSSTDFLTLFLGVELQSYSCAPSEACVEEVCIFIYILSDIIGPNRRSKALDLKSYILGYLPRVIAIETANNYSNCIADYKSKLEMGLPLSKKLVSGGSHGQDNKLDTYQAAPDGLNALCREKQHLIGNLKFVTGRLYCNDSQEPYANFNKEDQSAQGPKTTISNIYTQQPRDLTAYGHKLPIHGYKLCLVRGRNLHMSGLTNVNHKTTKGGSRKSLILDLHDSNSNDGSFLNLAKDSKSPLSISS